MSTLHVPRVTSLARCLAFALGLAESSVVPANTLSVTSCVDDGSTGTLRQVVASAADGDTVDLSTSFCSIITLSRGEIPVAINNLTLTGSVVQGIDAANNSRVLHHTGVGILEIDYLTLTGGKYTSNAGSALGGCVLSGGTVKLFDATIKGCTVEATGSGSFFNAAGAGIWAQNVLLSHSQVTGNTAIATNDSRNTALGGGIYAKSNFTGDHSTISGNVVSGSSGARGFGGGAFAGGTATIRHSVIDTNQSSDYEGGLSLQAYSSGGTDLIETSTISGNSAKSIGGLAVFNATLQLYNSTIAFNSSTTRQAVYLGGNATIVSSIIAKNTSASTFQDLYEKGALDGFSRNNLIVSSNKAPADTIRTDPQLAPLAYHGGVTRTHALNPLSPAVDNGLATTSGGSTDQRDDSRSVGAAPDIGAYERQIPDDEIFYGGFD